MKENADKYLDDLSRKVIGKSAIESPSFHFTNNIMSQIKELGTSRATTYVPLISKPVWLAVGLVIACVIGYAIFGSYNAETTWLEHLKLNRYVDFVVIDSFTDFNVSKTMLYITLVFAIMLAIQIPILKHQLDKRFK